MITELTFKETSSVLDKNLHDTQMKFSQRVLDMFRVGFLTKLLGEKQKPLHVSVSDKFADYITLVNINNNFDIELANISFISFITKDDIMIKMHNLRMEYKLEQWKSNK